MDFWLEKLFAIKNLFQRCKKKGYRNIKNGKQFLGIKFCLNVFRWFGLFPDEQEEAEWDPRSVRPAEYGRNENFEKIRQLLSERHIILRMIAQEVKISKGIERKVVLKDLRKR